MLTMSRARRFLGVVSMFGVLSTMAAAVLGGGVVLAQDGGGKAASATGSGQVMDLGELRTFAFNAQRGADGVVTGQLQLNNRGLDRITHGDIVCVGTFGNTAFVGTQFVTSTDPATIGTYGIFTVIDNGEGSRAPADQLSLVYSPYDLATVTNWCAGAYGIEFQRTFLALRPIKGGNIQVR
jgi:hypothetical protein